MNRSGTLIPEPLAVLPWMVILLVAAIGSFGLVVLYSAARGSLRPLARSQGIRYANAATGPTMLTLDVKSLRYPSALQRCCPPLRSLS